MTVDTEQSWSFARSWRTVAELQPDRDAIVCGDRRLSFAQLDPRAGRLACVLRDAGVGPGHKVAIMCVNSPEYLEAFYAAPEARRGARKRQLPVRGRRARVTCSTTPTPLRSSSTTTRGHGRGSARNPPGRAPTPNCCSSSPARGRRRADRGGGRLQARDRWRAPGSPDRPRAGGRRPRVLVHRRHDRQPQGRDVAFGRPVRRALADVAAGHPAPRRGGRDRARASARQPACPHAR